VLVRTEQLEDAVLALEAGRSALLSEALNVDRADLGRLSTTRATLVDRYQTSSKALVNAMRRGAQQPWSVTHEQGSAS
jgi:hypothetical protein